MGRIQLHSLFLSFFLVLLPFSLTAQWSSMPSPSTFATRYVDMAIDGSGYPVVAYLTDTIAPANLGVYRYDGNNWIALGSTPMASNLHPTQVELEVNPADNSVWVCTRDFTSDRLTLRRFDGTVWQAMGGLDFSDPLKPNSGLLPFRAYSFQFDRNNQAVVAYPSVTGDTSFVKRFNGTTWQTVGLPVEKAAGVNVKRHSFAIDTLNNYYLMRRNDGGGYEVWRFTGSIWTELPLNNLPSPLPDLNAELLSLDSNYPGIVYGDGNNIGVRKYDGISWVPFFSNANVVNERTTNFQFDISRIAKNEWRLVYRNNSAQIKSLVLKPSILEPDSPVIITNSTSFPTYFVCRQGPERVFFAYPEYLGGPARIEVKFNCKSSSVNIGPTAYTNLCEGSTLTISAAFQSTPTSIQWSYNNVLIPNANLPSYTIGNLKNSNVGLYKVRAFNACGSQSEDSVYLNSVSGFVAQPVRGNDTSLCIGNGFFFNPPVNALSPTYTWIKNGSVTVSTLQNFNGVVDLSLEGTYFLRVNEGASSCEFESKPFEIIVRQSPTVVAPADFSVCGNKITFSGTSFTESKGVLWTNQTSAVQSFVPSANAVNPTFIIPQAMLSLPFIDFRVITTGNPCFNPNDNVRVSLNNSALPQVNLKPDTTILGNSLTVNASGTGNFNWITYGDGQFSDNTIINPVYTLGPNDTDAGAAQLVLRVTGSSPCEAFSKLDSITIRLNPTLEITGTVNAPSINVRLFKIMNGYFEVYKDTISDGTGNFIFKEVNNGNYLIVARYSVADLIFNGNVRDWASATPIQVNGSSVSGISISNPPRLRDLLSADTLAKYFGGRDVISGYVTLRLPSNLRTANGGDEKPLQDATVYLLSDDGNTRLDATTTDENGTYTFSGLNGVTYNIQVEYPSTVYEVPPTTVSADGDDASVDLVNAAMIKSQTASGGPSNATTFKLQEYNHFVLYPVPAESFLTIERKSGPEYSSYRLFNASGELMEEGSIVVDHSTMRLNTSKLNAGIYFLSFYSEKGETTTLKFSKD
jgi:hypothetical protein